MLSHPTVRPTEFRDVNATTDPVVLSPSRFTRLAAAARASHLDALLARGADPSSSAQLAARAEMLSAPRARTVIADQLDRLARADTTDQGGRWGVRPNRNAIIANTDAMLTLSALLRETAPIYVRGTAILSELLRDGTGPLYRGDSSALATRLHAALAAVRRGQPEPETARVTEAQSWALWPALAVGPDLS
jgi:hypothetical protein